MVHRLTSAGQLWVLINTLSLALHFFCVFIVFLSSGMLITSAVTCSLMYAINLYFVQVRFYCVVIISNLICLQPDLVFFSLFPLLAFDLQFQSSLPPFSSSLMPFFSTHSKGHRVLLRFLLKSLSGSKPFTFLPSPPSGPLMTGWWYLLSEMPLCLTMVSLNALPIMAFISLWAREIPRYQVEFQPPLMTFKAHIQCYIPQQWEIP